MPMAVKVATTDELDGLSMELKAVRKYRRKVRVIPEMGNLPGRGAYASNNNEVAWGIYPGLLG